MKKNRIERIWTELRHDDMPDTSCIGEYTDNLKPGVIVRAYDEFYEKLPAEMERDYDGRFIGKGKPELPARGREYRGFKPYAGGEPVGTKDYYKYGMQDYKHIEGLNRGDWCFVGIIAKAEIVTGTGTIQIIRSGGLWGIESDSDESYINEIRNEQVNELSHELESLGFGKRAIVYALQNAEHNEDIDY